MSKKARLLVAKRPGRPAFLKNPVKKLYTLEPRHVERLLRIQRREKLNGQSETLRYILDTLE